MEDKKQYDDLRNTWREFSDLNEKTGFTDANGKEYKTGDIVYNPCFGDLWFVQKVHSDEEQRDLDLDVPYYFTLYGNPDEHYMGLDEPMGFTIAYTKDDSCYNDILEDFHKHYLK